MQGELHYVVLGFLGKIAFLFSADIACFRRIDPDKSNFELIGSIVYPKRIAINYFGYVCVSIFPLASLFQLRGFEHRNAIVSGYIGQMAVAVAVMIIRLDIATAA